MSFLANLKLGQEVIDQLEYVDFLVAKDRRGKFDNPPGMYVFYVRDNIAPRPTSGVAVKTASTSKPSMPRTAREPRMHG